MLSHLNVSEFWAGKAGHSFEKPVGSAGDAFEPRFSQSVIGMQIDDFTERYDAPFPNHIKIDVDGNEPYVVQGMKKTLSGSRLKGVSIQLNTRIPAALPIIFLPERKQVF